MPLPDWEDTNIILGHWFESYKPFYFHGGSVSWAAQGFCSICSWKADKPKGAEWMVKHGKHYRAYCDDCLTLKAKRIDSKIRKKYPWVDDAYNRT